jgi:hypothetical protein
MFATNKCLAKGGIGIVSTNLYVDLKSAESELGFEFDMGLRPTP